MDKEIRMEERRKISKKVAIRYQRESKGVKGKILDEFIELTGYNRSYASWLLRNAGEKVVIYRGKGWY